MGSKAKGQREVQRLSGPGIDQCMSMNTVAVSANLIPSTILKGKWQQTSDFEPLPRRWTPAPLIPMRNRFCLCRDGKRYTAGMWCTCSRNIRKFDVVIIRITWNHDAAYYGYDEGEEGEACDPALLFTPEYLERIYYVPWAYIPNISETECLALSPIVPQMLYSALCILPPGLPVTCRLLEQVWETGKRTTASAVCCIMSFGVLGGHPCVSDVGGVVVVGVLMIRRCSLTTLNNRVFAPAICCCKLSNWFCIAYRPCSCREL